MVSFLSTVGRYSEYGADFLMGTGAETVGKSAGLSVKNRKKNGMTFTKAVKTGFQDGFVKAHKNVDKVGFFKNLGNTFSNMGKEMSKTWNSKTGFKKLSALKHLGKAMPFLMNVFWLATSIPDIVSRTKDEGILGGIKETGKAILNMSICSVTAAAGTALFGLPGTLLLPIAAGIITSPLIGEPYSVKKAQKAEEQKQAEAQQNNPFIPKPTVGQKLDITSRA